MINLKHFLQRKRKGERQTEEKGGEGGAREGGREGRREQASKKNTEDQNIVMSEGGCECTTYNLPDIGQFSVMAGRFVYY